MDETKTPTPNLLRTDLTPNASMETLQKQIDSLTAAFAAENAALKAKVAGLEKTNANRVAGVITVDFLHCNTCGQELEPVADEVTLCPTCGLSGIVNHVGTNPQTGAMQLVKQEQPYVAAEGLTSKRVDVQRAA